MKTPIDTNFDQITDIPGLSVNNLREISFEDMLKILTPFVLVQIPEDSTTVDEKRRLDYLLARCANLHAYLRVLWSQATYLRAQFKRDTLNPDSAETMQKKKEVLYELANAMKLKYEAASRKITVALESEGDESVSDRVDYAGRRETRDARAEKVETKPTVKGGWGSVGK